MPSGVMYRRPTPIASTAIRASSSNITGDQPYGGEVIVKTRIVQSGSDPVTLNYLMRQNGQSWQISDVYLDGTISQLATQRSEFQSILRREGVTGLIGALNRKVDLLTSGPAE